jgi:hypothetical protein
MTALWVWIRRCGPLAQGFLGALLVLALYLAVTWTAARWNEFVVMRSVVSQILENDRKAHSAPTPPPKSSEGEAK